MLSRVAAAPSLKRLVMKRALPATPFHHQRSLKNSATAASRHVNCTPNSKHASRRIHSSSKSGSAISPTDMLMSSSLNPPSREQLKSLFISAAVPMVGFGFMDNFIMIQAGGYIDATLGVTMGLATLTAAAMGQVFSDVSGVLFGGTVERISERLRLVKPAQLTQAQRALPLCRNISMAGSVVGIILGCFLGASSLFFVDLEARDRQKRAAELKDVVSCMLATEEGSYDQGCTLYLTSRSTNFDVSKACQESSKDGPQICQLTDKDELATQCAQRREMIVDHARMYVPVMARDGSAALGVLEFRKSLQVDDEKTGKLLARHLAIFMERMD
jgi:hypothetical protein